MKRLLFYIPLLFIITGCVTPSIKLPDIKRDQQPLSMFGATSAREFFVNNDLGINFTKKWESSAHGNFTNNSVIVYDKYVFINDLSGRIFCINIDNGKQLGSVKYDGVIYTAPIIENFLMTFAVVSKTKNESQVICYDIITGKIRNQTTVEGKIQAQPLRYNDLIILVAENGTVYKFNLAGNKVSEIKIQSRTHSNPALYRDIIVFGTDKGELVAVDLSTDSLLYRNKLNLSIFAGAMIHDGQIYIGDDNGTLFNIDLTTGVANWSYETGSRIIMTPAFDDQNIYIGNLKGDIFSLSKQGQLNWKRYLGGLLHSTPLVAATYLYQPNLNGNLIILNKSNGDVVKSIAVEGRLRTSPVFTKNLFFIGHENGLLSAYEIN